VGEIDYAHQSKHDGQTRGGKKQHRTDAQTIQDLREKEFQQ
jgi:hypothetical protein